MAKETIVRLTDDLDGSEAAEEVLFGFRGVEYQIDLSAKNAAALEKLLAKYIDAGRRVSRSVPRRSARNGARPTSASRQQMAGIRDWARSNGYKISDRGRISTEIRDAYAAARV